MEETAGLVAKYWKVIAGIIGGVFSIGYAQSRVVKKTELYNKDGSQIYVTSKKFDKAIEDITTENKAQTATLTDMNFTLGQIDQFMKDHIK